MTASAQSLAQVITGPLVGYLIDRTGNYDVGMVALGLAAVPGAVAFAFWPMPTKTDAPLTAAASGLETR